MKQNTQTSNYDKMVYDARDIFLEYDQEKLIKKYNLTADENNIEIEYLQTSYRICRKTARVDEKLPDGTWHECRAYNTVMTIYDLLCFSKGEDAPRLSGIWCPISEFLVIAGANQTEKCFTKRYAELFQENINKFDAACIKLGGTPDTSAAKADITYLIPVTNFFPVLLQMWKADEEFPPELLFLWDKRAIDFMHYETMFFLQNDILKRLEKIITSN